MITSTANAQVKQILQLQKKSKHRNEQGVFLVEGYRMFYEVPKNRVVKIYVSESFFEKRREEISFVEAPLEVLSDHVFSYVSDTKTPQGVLCIVKQDHYDMSVLAKKKNPFFLVLDNLQDPGNLGTILRTAEGAGVDGIFLSKDCVDIYNPKVIRSTMGSIYRVPFSYEEDLCKTLVNLKKQGISLCAAHLDGTCDYDREDYKGGIAFLIGNEGNGLRDEVARQAEKKVLIPMCGEVESLNAAVAASILMFEVSRQRRM